MAPTALWIQRDATGPPRFVPHRPSPAGRVPSPALRRAVRGNSGIAEAQLMFGVWALTAARVDGRGFFDGAEVAAFEQAQGDQIGEAEDRDVDAVAAGGDAQQGIGDHRGKQLEA